MKSTTATGSIQKNHIIPVNHVILKWEKEFHDFRNSEIDESGKSDSEGDFSARQHTADFPKASVAVTLFSEEHKSCEEEDFNPENFEEANYESDEIKVLDYDSSPSFVASRGRDSKIDPNDLSLRSLTTRSNKEVPKESFHHELSISSEDFFKMLDGESINSS